MADFISGMKGPFYLGSYSEWGDETCDRVKRELAANPWRNVACNVCATVFDIGAPNLKWFHVTGDVVADANWVRRWTNDEMWMINCGACTWQGQAVAAIGMPGRKIVPGPAAVQTSADVQDMPGRMIVPGPAAMQTSADVQDTATQTLEITSVDASTGVEITGDTTPPRWSRWRNRAASSQALDGGAPDLGVSSGGGASSQPSTATEPPPGSPGEHLLPPGLASGGRRLGPLLPPGPHFSPGALDAATLLQPPTSAATWLQPPTSSKIPPGPHFALEPDRQNPCVSSNKIEKEPDDWICPNCGDVVFRKKKQCRRCFTIRDVASEGTSLRTRAGGFQGREIP